ncbi:MAG TPA: hypothetical protein PLZ44_05535 [Methanothrix sp.]|nr:hypothetical protein [Methanothrix sp.]
MKHLALIPLFLLLLSVSVDSTVYLYSGNDSYGIGLSYPGYASPLSYSVFAFGNNSTSISPVLLRATMFRPEFEVQRYRNSSAYSHPILPLLSQFSFYLPFPGIDDDWSFGSYDGPTSSVKNFLGGDSNQSSAIYETSTIRQFALQDSYHEGVEAHDDQTRMGLNNFLDSDEPPGSPLL